MFTHFEVLTQFMRSFVRATISYCYRYAFFPNQNYSIDYIDSERLIIFFLFLILENVRTLCYIQSCFEHKIIALNWGECVTTIIHT